MNEFLKKAEEYYLFKETKKSYEDKSMKSFKDSKAIPDFYYISENTPIRLRMGCYKNLFKYKSFISNLNNTISFPDINNASIRGAIAYTTIQYIKTGKIYGSLKAIFGVRPFKVSSSNHKTLLEDIKPGRVIETTFEDW